MHPVVFPNGGWKSISEEEGPHPVHGSPEWKELEEIIQSDALTALTDNHKNLLLKYRLDFVNFSD